MDPVRSSHPCAPTSAPPVRIGTQVPIARKTKGRSIKSAAPLAFFVIVRTGCQESATDQSAGIAAMAAHAASLEETTESLPERMMSVYQSGADELQRFVPRQLESRLPPPDDDTWWRAMTAQSALFNIWFASVGRALDALETSKARLGKIIGIVTAAVAVDTLDTLDLSHSSHSVPESVPRGTVLRGTPSSPRSSDIPRSPSPLGPPKSPPSSLSLLASAGAATPSPVPSGSSTPAGCAPPSAPHPPPPSSSPSSPSSSSSSSSPPPPPLPAGLLAPHGSHFAAQMQQMLCRLDEELREIVPAMYSTAPTGTDGDRRQVVLRSSLAAFNAWSRSLAVGLTKLTVLRNDCLAQQRRVKAVPDRPRIDVAAPAESANARIRALAAEPKKRPRAPASRPSAKARKYSESETVDFRKTPSGSIIVTSTTRTKIGNAPARRVVDVRVWPGWPP